MDSLGIYYIFEQGVRELQRQQTVVLKKCQSEWYIDCAFINYMRHCYTGRVIDSIDLFSFVWSLLIPSRF